ncbi:GerMN domain-containing protein [Brevibacillus sp. SYP-B805]|uniref:GerMN domain-containing protein n=1 Tax=Brevibacillus sp. SYP-B805 TaxID=1578199 RepID=UPI0013EC2573|nr:GerMN domain-containing protein [Brevibacillus sp. SYP-B805]NGQ96008.1 GerMN domain-containing protein [Brevibacillus sp. SYP-B805]
MKRLLFLLMLASLLAGCGSKTVSVEKHPDPQAEAGQETGAAAGGKTATAASGETQEQPPLTKAVVTAYYADDQLTGLLAEKQEIRYANDVDKYKQALALLEHPAQKGHNPLWQNFAYHSVTFADGQLTIDTKGSNVYNLGAEGEEMALEALKKTLYQFPEVKKIVLLRDGQPIDSLMGHVSLEDALTK